MIYLIWIYMIICMTLKIYNKNENRAGINCDRIFIKNITIS
jgi:hypothetical protein